MNWTKFSGAIAGSCGLMLFIGLCAAPILPHALWINGGLFVVTTISAAVAAGLSS